MSFKNRIFLEPTDIAGSDTIGSYVLDPSGNLIDPREIRALTNADVVTAEQGTSPWVVSATDLDIRDLTSATDSVTVEPGTNPLDVTATDLDIRDLTAASDSVQAWAFDGTGTAITSTTAGASQALDVNLVNEIAVAIRGVYDAGTNPNPDNVGIVAGTRSASPADSEQTFRPTGGAASSDDVTAANVQGLDVNSFMMAFDSVGGNWDRVRQRNNELLVNDVANAAILQTQKNVTTSTGALLASQLANRKYLLIQNTSSGICYIGASGVTTANGFPIGNGSVAELRCGPAVDVHAVANAGTKDVRILELS